MKRIMFVIFVIALLQATPAFAGPLLVHFGANYETAEFEGGLFGTGPEVQTKLDYVFYSPARVLHFTVAPLLSYGSVSGSLEEESFTFSHTDVGAEFGLIAVLSPALRLSGRLAYRHGIGAALTLGEQEFAATNYRALAHSWSLATPISASSRIGGNISWMNSSFDVSEIDSVKGVGRSMLIGAFYARRI